jgi:hypothetical protein
MTVRRTTRILTATIAGAALAVAAAPSVSAAGLRNCVDLTGHDANRVGCYELVWVDGAEVRMTFANVQFRGKVPSDGLGVFYVTAPQDDTPQSEEAVFAHDHTVGGVPRQNHGTYSVRLRTFFVLCAAAAIDDGACEPTVSTLAGLGDLALATTVNGQALTSADVIEAAADDGLVTLMDTGQAIIGTISGS